MHAFPLLILNSSLIVTGSLLQPTTATVVGIFVPRNLLLIYCTILIFMLFPVHLTSSRTSCTLTGPLLYILTLTPFSPLAVSLLKTFSPITSSYLSHLSQYPSSQHFFLPHGITYSPLTVLNSVSSHTVNPVQSYGTF